MSILYLPYDDFLTIETTDKSKISLELKFARISSLVNGTKLSLYFTLSNLVTSGPEVIKLFSCSTQLSMKFFPLTNVKMPTVVGILTFMSGKNSILGLCEPKKNRIS